jgi:hypothetical protein
MHTTMRFVLSQSSVDENACSVGFYRTLSGKHPRVLESSCVCTHRHTYTKL